MNSLVVRIIEKVNQDIVLYPLVIFFFSGFFLYVNTFGNYWAFDDFMVVVKNKDILSLQQFFENTYSGRPLRELSFMLDYKLFGPIPIGWHFQNIFWHSLNAWLVFVLATLLTEKKRIAWTAALLFLAHPIQVEVVAQISHRKDSLSLFFMLAAFVLYLFSKQKHKYLLLLFSGICMCLGFFAKQNAALMPVFIVLYELLVVKDEVKLPQNRWWVLLVISFIGFCFIYPLLNNFNYVYRAEWLLLRHGYFSGFDAQVYMRAVINSWGFLVCKLFFPVELSVNYYIPPPGSWFSLSMVKAYLLLILFLVGSIVSFRRYTTCFFALLWFGVFFLATANLVPLDHLAADRYLYAPTVGFVLLIAVLLDRFSMKASTHLSLALCILCVMAVLTVQQNKVWKNDAALWSQSLKVNPDSPRAISNVGFLVFGEELEKNLEMQLTAVKKNPKDLFINYRLGRVYEERKDIVNALRYYREAKRQYRLGTHSAYKEALVDLSSRIERLGKL